MPYFFAYLSVAVCLMAGAPLAFAQMQEGGAGPFFDQTGLADMLSGMMGAQSTGLSSQGSFLDYLDDFEYLNYSPEPRSHPILEGIGSGSGIGGALGGSSITMELFPANPAPQEVVTAEVVNHSMDLSRAKITWFLNEEEVVSGVGARQLQFRVGAPGSTLVVRAEVVPDNGRGVPVRASTTLRPAFVTIAWEALTYTPPLYQGKALATPMASVRFVALPYFLNANGALEDPDTLVYNWFIGAGKLGEQSGVGKHTVVLANSRFMRPIELRVEVEDMARSRHATYRRTVDMDDPYLALYELHPRYGAVYERQVGGSYRIAGQEANLMAEPYFFSVPSRDAQPLRYRWLAGGAEVLARDLITLRPVGEGAGQTSVHLEVNHTSEILQREDTDVRISFVAASRANAGDGADGTYEEF